MKQEDVISGFSEFHAKVMALQEQVSAVFEERVKWCRENRIAIKAALPKGGKIYEIIDMGKLSNYVLTQLDNPNERHLLKVNPAQKFRPDRQFCLYEEFPTVYGTLLTSNMIEVFQSVYVSIDNLREPQPVDPSKAWTNVYVMIDKNTGMYKIGRSINPSARERTLQSEKPTIELLFSFPAQSSDEKILHEMFSEYRVRGEWFDLNSSQLAVIKDYLTRSKP